MYNLPSSTLLNRQLPKTKIYQTCDIPSSNQAMFDADIARLSISNVISPKTIPALSEGEQVKCIYVISIIMKSKEYNPVNIIRLNRMIPQKMIFVLIHDNQAQLAIFHDKLIVKDWQSANDVSIFLQGHNLDFLWENIVKSVGGIVVEEGNDLSKQIAVNSEKEKIRASLELLEKKLGMKSNHEGKLNCLNK